METFDLAIAYVWEYDEDFVNLLEDIFHKNELSTFRIGYHNINEVQELIRDKKLHFHFYLDRAWDVEEEFEKLGKQLEKRKTIIFNPYKNVLHAIDKATMHLEFITSGINVPYSIIIPPHSEDEEIFIALADLKILGRPFIIKPCNTTGGGLGVVLGAETLHDVLRERINLIDDKYILQEKIIPTILDNKRAWFRSFWAFNEVIPTWWDDQTHLYTELTNDDVNKFNLSKIFTITKTIHKITNLDFFSSEIALDEKGKYIVVDYVNDQCDLRFKSKHYDGVPDAIIIRIIENMKKEVMKLKRKINLPKTKL